MRLRRTVLPVCWGRGVTPAVTPASWPAPSHPFTCTSSSSAASVCVTDSDENGNLEMNVELELLNPNGGVLIKYGFI